MKIRYKLFFSFSLYILLAVILAFFSYNELRTINTRLTSVELVDDISNIILEVRRYEKNFLLFRNEESFKEIRAYLTTLKKNIDGIKIEIVKEIGTNEYTLMKNTITEYEHHINNLANNLRSREKLTTEVEEMGILLEQNLHGKDLDSFLTLRKHEKNIMLSKDQTTYETFQSFNPLNLQGNSRIETYRGLVSKLFENYKTEKDLTDKIRSTAREMETITKNLSKKEREYIDVTLKKSGKLLLFGLLTIIILGIVINMKLSRNIAHPIKRLEGITKKIAKGDFSEMMEVKGTDEIASLEMSFNQMEKQLLDTKISLEHAIEKLSEKQAQLVETAKLATLGTFAAGVAHEINNPLAIINEKAGLMKDILEMSEDFKHKDRFLNMIDAIFKSVKRCRTITHRILGFSRKTEVSIETFDLNDMMREIAGFFEKEMLYKSIHLDLNLKENLPKVKSDKGQLQQVFLNIIKNAIDAVHDGGSIAVTTDNKDENMINVAIRDNGHGIPEKALQYIFEPFFTTKEKGKGTGLGLSITYGIIKNLGGDIHVESEVNKGTTFIVEVPVNSELTKGEIV